MIARPHLVPLFSLFLVLTGLVMAQRRFGGGGNRSGLSWGGGRLSDTTRTAREMPSGSTGTPTWDESARI